MKIICKCGQKYEIDEKDREYFLKQFICINCNRKLFEVFLDELSKDLFNRPVNSDVSMIIGMLNILIGAIITIILIGNNRGFEAIISLCTFTYAGVMTILIGKTVACFIKK